MKSESGMAGEKSMSPCAVAAAKPASSSKACRSHKREAKESSSMRIRSLVRLAPIALICAVFAVFGGFASAQFNGCPAGFCNSHNVAAPSYTGSCDISGANCALFYGLRAATGAIASAATQPLANIRNTATNETCDVIVATNGGFGVVSNCSGSSGGDTVAVFCAESAGSCVITKFYNQITGTTCSSSNCDIFQNTAADQSALTQSCLNSLPCAAISSAVQIYGMSNSFTITTNTSSAGVWNYSAASSVSVFLNPSNGTSVELQGTGTTNTLVFTGFFTSLNFTASAASWHAITNSALNSSSSFAMVDGTATTGSVNGNGGTNVFSQVVHGANSVTLDFTEMMVSNTGWAQATATAVCKNEQAYWGAGNFGASC